MKSLARNLLAAAGFALFIFGVGIFRETQVDGRPFRTAVATASIAAGVVLFVLVAGIFLVSRGESAKAPARSSVDDADAEFRDGVQPEDSKGSHHRSR